MIDVMNTVEIERRLFTMAYEVQRLQEAVTRLSQETPKSWMGNGDGGGGAGLATGLVTTAIPTGTPAAPSTTGMVQIYVAGSASGDPVAVNNAIPISASIAVGKAVMIGVVGSDYYLVSTECP